MTLKGRPVETSVTLTHREGLTTGTLCLTAFTAGGVRAVPLQSETPIVVGRGADCALRVDTLHLSRRHFVVAMRSPPGSGTTLEDLGSSNGTKLNGATIPSRTPVPVEAGNLIEAGNVFFTLKSFADSVQARIAPVEGADGASGDAQQPPGMSRIVLADPEMARLCELVKMIARSDISALILGETGVGKEVFSSLIHELSLRASRPLLSINCAAMPESLLESELFGYERGAFSGATQAQAGLIESADKGTLFLDEVGEMSLAMQAKLLRAFESGEVMRLGARKARIVDVRYIAATNRDLPSLVAKGLFRRDTYYRLNGITIPMPPLRARAADVEPLAKLFLSNGAKKAARPTPEISAPALERLKEHAWPGNVRELRAVMDRSLALCRGESIELAHIVIDRPIDEAPPAAQEMSPEAAGLPVPPQRSGLLRRDAEQERKLVVEALARAGGNQRKASEILGISRRTLTNRLNEFGLVRPRKGQ